MSDASNDGAAGNVCAVVGSAIDEGGVIKVGDAVAKDDWNLFRTAWYSAGTVHEVSLVTEWA